MAEILKSIRIENFKGLRSVELRDCGDVNALIGKNNSGKSSILHALEIAGLVFRGKRLSDFPHQAGVEDLFDGQFTMELLFGDGSSANLERAPGPGDQVTVSGNTEAVLKTVLIDTWPSYNFRPTGPRSPRDVLDDLTVRASNITPVDSLFAVRYYAEQASRGFDGEDYDSIRDEIRKFLPDIDSLESNREDDNLASLRYAEYGKDIDILHTGSGMKNLLNILIKTVASQANVVLLEEPETGLHPDLQRRLLEFLDRVSKERQVQFFMATQSPVLLNYAENANIYSVRNRKGEREIVLIPKEARHTCLGDLGIRPSDLFNHDICVLVEGPADVIYFEHLIRELYRDDLAGVTIAVQQYGGSALDGIRDGTIKVSNITTAQGHVLSIHDRDEPEGQPPDEKITALTTVLERDGIHCRVLNRRELEYYIPLEIHQAVQRNDAQRAAVEKLLKDQTKKYKNAAGEYGVIRPLGQRLRELLREHLTDKSLLPEELQTLMQSLVDWKEEILGVPS